MVSGAWIRLSHYSVKCTCQVFPIICFSFSTPGICRKCRVTFDSRSRNLPDDQDTKKELFTPEDDKTTARSHIDVLSLAVQDIYLVRS